MDSFMRRSENSQLLKDIENLMKDMEQVDLHLNLQQIPDKVILLLGQTKAGKTTLMYYLLGKKLIRELNKELGLHQMKPQAKIFDALIGNDYQSTTVYPNIPTELGEDKVLIIDMPGFSDTRSAYRLLNIYIVREVIKKIKSVHVSLVIPIQHLEANQMIDIVQRNCLLLNRQLLASPGCLSFILTKIVNRKQELQAFNQSLDVLRDEKSEQFSQIETIVKANTYIFEDNDPLVEEGLQLKHKITSQNNFFPTNEQPQNLLSQSYAQVISGSSNQQQFVQFLMNLLKGISQTLKNVIDLFSALVRLHHRQDFQLILLIEQQKEEDIIQDIVSLAKEVLLGNVCQLQNPVDQRYQQQTNQTDRLLKLCQKYYKTIKNQKNGPLLLHQLQNFIEWARIFETEQSKISNQLRKSIHKLFIFFTNTIRTIIHINNNTIAKYVQEIVDSTQIKHSIQRYTKTATDCDLLVRIAHNQNCQELVQTQEFKDLLLTFYPNFEFQEGEEVIENVKVATRGNIKNQKINNMFLQTMKLQNKPVYKQHTQKNDYVADISQDSINVIKNMPIGSNFLEYLITTILLYKKSLEETTIPIRVAFGLALFRKIAEIMQKLEMYEEACLFYLAIPAQLQAQNLINTAICFKELSPSFVVQILIPYYSRVNINFQMVQKLFNYLSLNIYDYSQLIQNEKLLIETLQNMRDVDPNSLITTKRFSFNFINFIENEDNRSKLIGRAVRRQALLASSKLQRFKDQLLNLTSL